jgi:hypothetical protein
MTMDGILEEAVDKAIGASSKKWALLLIGFVAGGAAALWLVRRQGGPSDVERAAAPATEESGEPLVGEPATSSRSLRGLIRRVGRRVS